MKAPNIYRQVVDAVQVVDVVPAACDMACSSAPSLLQAEKGHWEELLAQADW